MLNKVQIIGNLGADPDTRTTQSGNSVANLRVATNERVKRGDSWEDHTEWHTVACFGRTAENVSRYLRKGSKVYVEGKLRTRKWTDRDGNDRYSTEIIADDIKFLDGASGGGGRDDDRGDNRGRGRGRGRNDSYDRPDDDIPY